MPRWGDWQPSGSQFHGSSQNQSRRGHLANPPLLGEETGTEISWLPRLRISLSSTPSLSATWQALIELWEIPTQTHTYKQKQVGPHVCTYTHANAELSPDPWLVVWVLPTWQCSLPVWLPWGLNGEHMDSLVDPGRDHKYPILQGGVEGPPKARSQSSQAGRDDQLLLSSPTFLYSATLFPTLTRWPKPGFLVPNPTPIIKGKWHSEMEKRWMPSSMRRNPFGIAKGEGN